MAVLKDQYGDPGKAVVTTADGLADVVSLVNSSGTAITNMPVAGDVASGATDSGNPVKIAGKYETTPGAVTTGQRRDIAIDSRGAIHAILMAPDSSSSFTPAPDNVDGVAVTASSLRLVFNTRLYRFNGTGWDREVKPNATVRLASAANTTNSTLVKNGAGNVFHISGYNAAVAGRWMKIYNKASAPTVGTDVPVLTLYLAPTAGFAFNFTSGYYLGTGIGFGLTTGSADADTGALTAADVLGLNVMYA